MRQQTWRGACRAPHARCGTSPITSVHRFSTIAAGGPPRVNVVAPTDRLDLSAAVEACALRIIQEAVINVRRHAAASCCEVRIVPGPDVLSIEIVDDGIGFA